MKNLQQQVDELTKRLQDIGKRIWKQGEEAAKDPSITLKDNPWKGTSHEKYIWQNGYVLQKHREWKKNKINRH